MGADTVRKKLGALAAAIALLGLTISIISPASSDTRYHHRTLHLAEKLSDDRDEFVDVGESGESVGDYFVINRDPLFNASRTEKVGESSGHCMFVDRAAECDVTFKLRGGLITVEGLFEFQESSRFAVTGGTGAYKTAHGTLTITEGDEGLDFVFRLLL